MEEKTKICKFLQMEDLVVGLKRARVAVQTNAFQREENLEERQRKIRCVGMKKCLFGKADPETTTRMLNEQYTIDRKRFLEQFGIDIEIFESDCDAKENNPNGLNVPETPTRKVLKAKRKVVFNTIQAKQSQQFITDYYHTRKTLTEKKILGHLQPEENQKNCDV
ncbi:hypothetical protein ABEB36_004980 [Hypothenemus hampei]|uniref:Uncharacterized protein n=1 Tax=Hypothenemus hampei TaxID=57062 RepID=A0ABD1EWJ5_HYPHA